MDIGERLRLYQEHEAAACLEARCIGRRWREGGLAVDYDDLEQEARLACWRASERYDPTRGVKFSTYMTGMVRGYCSHYRRDRVPMIHIPAHAQPRTPAIIVTLVGLAIEDVA